jgi:hypothetical protein
MTGKKHRVHFDYKKSKSSSSFNWFFSQKHEQEKKQQDGQTLFQKELFQFQYRVQHAQHTIWVRK